MSTIDSNVAAVAAQLGLDQFLAVSTIFDAAEIVVYVADMETHELLFLNRHAEAVWGSDAVGQKCYEVLQAGQTGRCSFCTNDRLLSGGKTSHPVVWEFQNTANKRWYLCIDKAIPWTGGRLVRMEVAIDITERKAHEQFRESYVGLISHDLRSPLSTITFSASILQQLLRKREATELEKPVDSILRSSRRMAEMIEDLLETTRLESGQASLHKTRFDLNELVNVVASRMAAEAARVVRIEVEGVAPVLADPARIERVLENLVSNAFRYSPAQQPVAIRSGCAAEGVVVTVTDFGVGIPAEELPKLFQPFYRASSAQSVNGLGLGLYNSRLILEGHGGRIWVKSERGAGSVFGITLPAAGGLA